MTTLGVRPATPPDVGLILALIRELAAFEREPDAVEATEEDLRRHLFGEGFGRGPCAECLIGEVDGKPQGFALFFTNFSTWRGRPGLYLEDLFVRPGARGQGLGRTLFLELARIALARGCGRMEWAVLDWNEAAIGFYRGLGAVSLDEWTVFRLTDAKLRDLLAGTR